MNTLQKLLTTTTLLSAVLACDKGYKSPTGPNIENGKPAIIGLDVNLDGTIDHNVNYDPQQGSYGFVLDSLNSKVRVNCPDPTPWRARLVVDGGIPPYTFSAKTLDPLMSLDTRTGIVTLTKPCPELSQRQARVDDISVIDNEQHQSETPIGFYVIFDR